jgi:lactoylglutathione lyase
MPAYSFNHIHLLTRDPKATAQYYHRMFGAKVIESIQSDGKPRIDLELGGVSIFILRAPPEQETPACPPGPYLGLDHFGLRVSNLDEAVAELKAKGAEFAVEPKTIRPGVRIAYVRGPENVRIELVEHT